MPFIVPEPEVEIVLGRRYLTYRIEGSAIDPTDTFSIDVPNTFPKACTLSYLAIETSTGVPTLQPSVTAGRPGGATTETAATSIENQQPLALYLENGTLTIDPVLSAGPVGMSVVVILAEGQDLRGA